MTLDPCTLYLTRRLPAWAAPARGRRGLGRFFVTRTRLRAPDLSRVTRPLATFTLPLLDTTGVRTTTGAGATRRR